MTPNDYFIWVKFTYHPELVAWIKALPGSEGSFHKATKSWRIAFECLPLLQAKAAALQVQVSILDMGP